MDFPKFFVSAHITCSAHANRSASALLRWTHEGFSVQSPPNIRKVRQGGEREINRHVMPSPIDHVSEEAIDSAIGRRGDIIKSDRAKGRGSRCGR